MGTKEVIMIVLGFIIVGIAIAAGLNMFVTQSFTNNKQATNSEMQVYAGQLIQFWGTTTDLGGASCLTANVTVPKAAAYLGFNGANNSFQSENGEFRVISVTSSSPGILVTLKALGKTQKGVNHPLITTTVKFIQATTTKPVVTTTLGEAAGF
jgi:hypothetical protein